MIGRNKDGGDSFELDQVDVIGEESGYPLSPYDGDFDSLLGTSDDDLDDAEVNNGTEKAYPRFTPDEERAVVRKLDRRLVLFIAFIYMLSFLDRSSTFEVKCLLNVNEKMLSILDIGNARIAGMTKDLDISSAQYEWLLTGFYCTYISFQWMTLLYSVIPPHVYISLCVASWSIIASLQSISGSFISMLILRILLGIGEAAFSPGIPFLLSFFFKREELALRTGLFIAAAPLATSFAGSLAWLITKAGAQIPISAWRLLFLIEGFPSIVVAVVAWYQIPDAPETAGYLNKREKKVARLRLLAEKNVEKKVSVGKSKVDWREISQTLKEPKCWITAVRLVP